MANYWFDYARRKFIRFIREETDPQRKAYLKDVLDHYDLGVVTAEEEIELAKMIGVRNPDFDGDLMGRPDDDFDDEDEDEE